MIDISKKFDDVQRRYHNLPIKKQRTVIGLSAALAFTAAAMTWVAFMPDRHEELEKWSETYTDQCYTHDDDEQTLKSRMAGNHVNSIHDHLLMSFPFGSVTSAELDEHLTDNVLCFGEGYKGRDVSRWPITGVTIVDENYGENFYARDLLVDGISSFWNRHVEDMEERLILGDALFFSRFERALETTYLIDQQYRVHYATYGEDTFNSPAWMSLKEHSEFGRVVEEYENLIVMSDQSRSTHDRTPKVVLQGTLHKFLTDGNALNEGDLQFMRRYYPHLEDSYDQCISYNKDNFCTGSITIYTDPPSYVHSRSISPEMLVELSGLLYGDREDSFLSVSDAETLMNDGRVMMLHSNDADYKMARIHSRIREYNTQRHYRGSDIDSSYLYTSDKFEDLSSRASERRPSFY
jgi:hypothetical protein